METDDEKKDLVLLKEFSGDDLIHDEGDYDPNRLRGDGLDICDEDWNETNY
jgi:hypothetical protein